MHLFEPPIANLSVYTPYNTPRGIDITSCTEQNIPGSVWDTHMFVKMVAVELTRAVYLRADINVSRDSRFSAK